MRKTRTGENAGLQERFLIDGMHPISKVVCLKGKEKAFEILDTVLAVVALVLGIGFALSGLGIGFANAIVAPLTNGALGLAVGIVFLVYALRFFKVIK